MLLVLIILEFTTNNILVLFIRFGFVVFQSSPSSEVSPRLERPAQGLEGLELCVYGYVSESPTSRPILATLCSTPRTRTQVSNCRGVVWVAVNGSSVGGGTPFLRETARTAGSSRQGTTYSMHVGWDF